MSTGVSTAQPNRIYERLFADASRARILAQLALVPAYLGGGAGFFLYGRAHPYQLASRIPRFSYFDLVGTSLILIGLVFPLLMLLQARVERRAFRAIIAKQPLMVEPLSRFLASKAEVATWFGIIITGAALIPSGLDLAGKAEATLGSLIGLAIFLSAGLSGGLLWYLTLLKPYGAAARGEGTLKARYEDRWYWCDEHGNLQSEPEGPVLRDWLRQAIRSYLRGVRERSIALLLLPLDLLMLIFRLLRALVRGIVSIARRILSPGLPESRENGRHDSD